MSFYEELVLNYLLVQGQGMAGSQSPLFLHIVPNNDQAMLSADCLSKMHHLTTDLFTQLSKFYRQNVLYQHKIRKSGIYID